MKKTFLLSLRIVTAKTEFAEGMGVGVVVSQEITFDLPDNHSEAMLQRSIAEYSDALMREEMTVDVKEIT